MPGTTGPTLVSIHFDDHVLACEPNARMSRQFGQGYFAQDTRFVSGYRLRLGGTAPVLLGSSAIRSFSSRFEFTNPDLDSAGGVVPANTMHLRLDRTIAHGIHEDYDVVNYGASVADVVLELSVECDFADIFDVRSGHLPRRGSIQTAWDLRHRRLTSTYTNGDFVRALRLDVVDAGCDAEFANGGISFRLRLGPGERWHTCVFWIAVGGDDAPRPSRTCSSLTGGDIQHDRARREWVDQATQFDTADPGVNAILQRAVSDLASLRMFRHDESAGGGGGGHVDMWVPAAGVPWFVTLFGRDALIVSLQTLALSPRLALGSLRALASLQGDAYDDARDMQPGKILHEIRHGELAFLKAIPHTPYYGAHEATTLYVWTAAQAYRWLGDRDALDELRPHVERALAWIDADGDIDGDGLQEYRTRAGAAGYFNQGWKDSGDGIPGRDGKLPSLPIALCEHQGYVVAAKRAWADTIESAYGERADAQRLRDAANRLAEQIEARFWWPDERTYYLGLDGDKCPIETVASNPGHLLWAGAIEPGRAADVARRLLRPDMWSGWGVRTLSSEHPAYNPFSYQRGSVWPHDNAIIADGLHRYGLREEAGLVSRAILDAASLFDDQRLPELFAGLERDAGGFPVRYLGANVPQAWASGAVVQILAGLMGLEADAPQVVVAPSLPKWLEHAGVRNLRVGRGAVDIVARRRTDGGHDVEVLTERGGVEVVTRD